MAGFLDTIFGGSLSNKPKETPKPKEVNFGTLGQAGLATPKSTGVVTATQNYAGQTVDSVRDSVVAELGGAEGLSGFNLMSKMDELLTSGQDFGGGYYSQLYDAYDDLRNTIRAGSGDGKYSAQDQFFGYTKSNNAVNALDRKDINVGPDYNAIMGMRNFLDIYNSGTKYKAEQDAKIADYQRQQAEAEAKIKQNETWRQNLALQNQQTQNTPETIQGASADAVSPSASQSASGDDFSLSKRKGKGALSSNLGIRA